MTVERIYLIRHGQTDWNADGRWQGHEQIPLNEDGIMQARALAAYLRHHPVSRIYSSDLVRALKTAEIVGEALGLTPIVDVRLRELHLGVLQGLTRAQIEQQHPQELEGFARDYLGYRVTKGESRLELQQRAYAAFEQAAADKHGSEAAMVMHGGTIKMLLMKLFADHPEVSTTHLDNTSITTVERNGGGWHLVQIGATPHLDHTMSDKDEH